MIETPKPGKGSIAPRWFQVLALSMCLPGSALVAQPKSPVPEQSPRKALVEMLLGGDDGIRKHLTLEVQRKLGDSPKAAALDGANPIQMLTMAKAAAGDNLETYEAGPILFSYEDPSHHQKLEVRIDGEDLRGGEDQMRLSLHSFRDGAEEELAAAVRFTLSWKAQQNVWRLNAITVSATVPIGDPRLFDKSRLPLPAITTATMATAAHVSDVSKVSTPASDGPATAKPRVVEGDVVNPKPAALRASEPAPAETGTSDTVGDSSTAARSVDAPKLPPVRVVRLIGLAENLYAQKHPETGFTCFLSELVNIGRGFEDGEPYKFIDPEIAHGIYNGYRFALTGCEGSPAKSFQIIAEPLSGTGRAYCSDATHELHGSDDGHGATCLASGKVVQR